MHDAPAVVSTNEHADHTALRFVERITHLWDQRVRGLQRLLRGGQFVKTLTIGTVCTIQKTDAPIQKSHAVT